MLPFRALATCVWLAAMLATSGCGETGETTERANVDSSLVNVLVDLHLADAREAVDGNPARGDSLRTLVYEIHGLDSTQLDQRLADISRQPGAIAALTEDVETQLALELDDASSPP